MKVYFSFRSSPVSEKVLLCLKIPRIRPLVLLIRVEKIEMSVDDLWNSTNGKNPEILWQKLSRCHLSTINLKWAGQNRTCASAVRFRLLTTWVRARKFISTYKIRFVPRREFFCLGHNIPTRARAASFERECRLLYNAGLPVNSLLGKCFSRCLL